MKKILVIDNNRTIVEMITSHLAECGYETSRAYDGIQALDIIKADRPDLIVLDLIMPKVDGFRLSKFLRSDPNLRDIPIIILTAIATEDDTNIYEVEADAFIAKGRIEDTLRHLLTTIRWIEAKRGPRREIIGMESLYPREVAKELLLVKQHFDAMLQVMTEGVLELDERNRIFFANGSATAMLGLSEIELFGRELPTVFPTHPDLARYLAEASSSRSARLPGVRLEVGQRVMRLVAAPLFVGKAFLGSIAVLGDVTAQERKERALEEVTSAIFLHAPIGIALVDADMRIVLANGQFRILGNLDPEDEMPSILDMPGIPPETLVMALECDAESAEPPRHHEIEVPATADRPAATLHLTVSALHQQGKAPYRLCLLEDISEKARLQRELVAANHEMTKANQAKSNFLAIVSHELRTPLSVIRGYLSLILDGRMGVVDGPLLEALQASDRRSRHLQHLIDELLDVSRIEAGKLTLREEEVILERVVREAADIFGGDFQRKGLTLALEVPENLPAVTADRDRILQVLVNLLSNAVKFTPAGGTVTVRGDRTPAGVTLAVEDSGAGIPGDKLHLIFNKFYQVDSSDTRQHSGAGLGLSIVRMIVEAMGGKVSVSSAEGKGSTFTVLFPHLAPGLAAAPSAEPSPAAASPRDATAPNRRTVLLCEDDEDTIEIVRNILVSAGYNLVVTTTCLEGIQKIYTGAIDLVLLDVRLPFMNGYDFCRVLRAVDATVGMPIVILSAAGQEDEIRMGYEAGATEYIVKPFDPAMLLSRIERHLAHGGSGCPSTPNP